MPMGRKIAEELLPRLRQRYRAGKFMEKVCRHSGYFIHLDHANLESMHRAGSDRS
jgi:hypothetical protein